MKIFSLILIISSSFVSFSQCKKEILKGKDFLYEGCLNYEGQPDGEGVKKVDFKGGDIALFMGNFKNGQFKSGEYTYKFKSGDENFINFVDFQNKIIEVEIYKWKNGASKTTFYNSGKKVREIVTEGEGDLKGLIIERLFIDDKIIELSNVKNNRVPEDIIGDEDYIDLNLIEEDNKFKIPIEFITKSDTSLTVNIHFDTGASGILLGNKLYLELLSRCDIVDLNVKVNTSGVGSKFPVKYILIKKIKIGNYTINNVVAAVPLSKDKHGNDINDMLIGIGFLKKFKDVSWSMNNNILRFYK